MDAQRTDAGDALTTTEMSRQLRADLEAVEAAGAVHAREEARWHRTGQRTDVGGPNGEGRDLIIAAERAAHQPEREAAATAAATAARAADANARAIHRQVGEDRISLPPTELSAASTMSPLIERDAERLSLPRLVTEVRAAVATGDRAAMYCWSRALAPRLANRPTGEERDEDQRARSDLGRLQSQIRETLRDTTFDAIRAQADRVLERASATRAAADRGKRALAGPVTTTDGRVKVAWPSS